MLNENKALPKTEALADVATGKDRLFHDGYVKGIAEFIETCATPMTIAIQGDWGTGKTSLLRLIEAKLHADAELPESDDPNEGDDPNTEEYCQDIIGVASIDVWQHYSANPQVNLFEVLLGEMVSMLAGMNLETIRWVSGFADAASKAVTETITSQISNGIKDKEEDSEGESFLDVIVSWFTDTDEGQKPKSQEEEVATAADVEAFRTTFIDALKQCAEERDKSQDARFAVFIDGLDHISPEATINLLEQLKTCLDCPRCVFVLSLDEQTVFDGVRKKFGDKVDERRQRLFFNRFVQVPFHIPSSAYNLDKYVKDLMKGREDLSDDFTAVIDTLLKMPTLRSIKRCLNTLFLYGSVFGESEQVPDESLAMLLAAVILQVESPQGFAVVAECAKGGEEHFVENVQAALEPLKLDDGVDWEALPVLWQGEEGNDVDTAKRSAFLSWVRKLV